MRNLGASRSVAPGGLSVGGRISVLYSQRSDVRAFAAPSEARSASLRAGSPSLPATARSFSSSQRATEATSRLEETVVTEAVEVGRPGWPTAHLDLYLGTDGAEGQFLDFSPVGGPSDAHA